MDNLTPEIEEKLKELHLRWRYNFNTGNYELFNFKSDDTKHTFPNIFQLNRWVRKATYEPHFDKRNEYGKYRRNDYGKK